MEWVGSGAGRKSPTNAGSAMLDLAIQPSAALRRKLRALRHPRVAIEVDPIRRQ